MIQAIRRMVKIESGGRIEIPASELNEGMYAEVIAAIASEVQLEMRRSRFLFTTFLKKAIALSHINS